MNGVLFAGALSGLISVIMGALGDHAFVLDAANVKSFDTALRYNMLYAAIVCFLSLINGRPLLRRAGLVFLCGSIVFSGGIYLSLVTGISALVYATPIGGMTIMAGWIITAYAAIKWQTSPSP